MVGARRSARLNPACFACGAQNLAGLRIKFRHEAGQITAHWAPTDGWESFQGTIHGGIISTVLDEAMSKAIIARGWEAMTADLRVRFRGRIRPGDQLTVYGWVTEKQKRRIKAEARLVSSHSDERAHAWATFLVLVP